MANYHLLGHLFFFRFWFCFKIRQSINSQEKENGKKKFIISMFFCLFVWFVCFFLSSWFLFSRKRVNHVQVGWKVKLEWSMYKQEQFKCYSQCQVLGGGETGSNQKCTCFILLLTCTARGIWNTIICAKNLQRTRKEEGEE